jgi:hypothetical protein
VIPLYIACQNAVVIFRKIEGNYLTFECFEASLPNEEVMKKSRKIQVTFPANPRLLVAPTRDILSTLANLLSYFSANLVDDALPKTKKGGDMHQETRNVASPRYISEAIAGILRATQPPGGPDIQTAYVTKRLDDHVLWKSAEKPWRRSPLWLLLRVSLQTTLKERGLNGGSGYKAFLAFFMAQILKDAIYNQGAPFTIDLLHFMNSKLGRRLVKMEDCVENESNTALRSVGDTVLEVSEFLKRQWGEVIRQWEYRKQWTPPDPSAFENCLTLTFANGQSYLRKVVCRRQELSKVVNTFDKLATETRLRSACAPRQSYNSSSLPSSIRREETNIAIFEFESWVQDHLQVWIDSSSRTEHDCLPLSKITNEYWSVASSHYEDNPEGFSLMFLCILELWVALDRLVCKWCELFQEYSPEIPDYIVDPLLLPYLNQVKRLHKVQGYIKRRHEGAFRGSIFQNINSPGSFANRFFGFRQASYLISLQTEIEAWASQQKKEKIEELKRKNAEYESKMAEYRSRSCTYFTNYDIWRDPYQDHNDWRCNKHRCQKEAQALRITPIEVPFPENRERTRAIVFELNCPKPIAIWRDMVTKILQADGTESQESDPEIYALSSYDPLGKKFYNMPYPGYRIGLASSAKSISASHYGNQRGLPASESQVIRKSAGQFALYDSLVEQWIETISHPDLRKQCTLSLKGPYEILQEFSEDTTHTPNQVLATQHQCPPDLSLTEYTVFGHIRAGNRLQWRNIIRALRTQTLTFSEPSVYFLIIQAIWQVGPMGDEGIYREAHDDLLDESFCGQALDELATIVQLVGDNWTQNLLLATAVSLTLRIYDFTQSILLKFDALEILKRARRVASRWLSMPPKKSHAPKDHISALPKHTLIGISLTLRATFDINTNDLDSLFMDGENLVRYLYAGTFISDLVDGSLPADTRFMAIRDRLMSLKCLPYVNNACRTRPFSLHRAVKRRWSEYKVGDEWHALDSPADRWWSCTTHGGPEYTLRTIHLNILDGTFLIDGRSFDRLPSDYTSHPSYKALFDSKVRFILYLYLHYAYFPSGN